MLIGGTGAIPVRSRVLRRRAAFRPSVLPSSDRGRSFHALQWNVELTEGGPGEVFAVLPVPLLGVVRGSAMVGGDAVGRRCGLVGCGGSHGLVK